MNNMKYNYNKSQQFAFNDSLNGGQHTRFFKNPILPMSMQSQQYPKKGNNNFTGSADNFYYNNGNIGNQLNGISQYHQQNQLNNGQMGSIGSSNFGNYGRQRFAPYFNKRSYAHALMQTSNQQRYFGYMNQAQLQQQPSVSTSNLVGLTNETNSTNSSPADSNYSGPSSNQSGSDFSALNLLNRTPLNNCKSNGSFDANNQTPNSSVTLQISNLDTTIEENELKQHLINRLKPITTVLSIYFESLSVAKIKLPSDQHARQVIAFLHRKKIGHKRITVSYTRESSTLDSSTLRCQVAGLLKDIPNYKLSMYKFRELFQSRFKTSISVIDLHEMKDICTIVGNKNEEFITLRTELIDSIENSELMECFQHSVPYCTTHFVKSHRGWAEQEIDPLPNVQMTIAHVRDMMYALLNNHKGVIPIASIVHCIQAELNVNLERNENGVNFEHLISCVQGVQITSNKFSIKILSWSNGIENSPNKDSMPDDMSIGRYSKYGNIPDSFAQVSREIIELIKLSPKATLKFSRFIPAYHNHFGKQCRVADYGYTKLIDLFEALSSVVQVMGEGENRQITLTHKIQMQRFKTDLLRILRSQSTKSLLLSHMPMIFEQVQGKKFNITDYGVCDINDILDALVNTNVVVVNSIPHIMDTMISIPKRKQSIGEVDKTCNFAAEVVELFKHASQYTILFEKFACSYHYHFGYQCRLSDYGFMKLADLMEAIAGIVEMEFSNEEDRKIFLSPKTAQRIFSEQLKSLIESYSGSSDSMMNLHEVLVFHKKQYGYQIMPQTLGFDDMLTCVKALPYIEVITLNGYINIQCHHDDQLFRQKCYAACRLLLDVDQNILPFSNFVQTYATKFNETLTDRLIKTMKHAIEIQYVNDVKCVTITKMLRFIIQIIGVIEPHGVIKIQDLTNLLKLTIKACFPFGYPNLFTFIQAFPDVFIYTPSKTNPMRGEVKVNNQCILSKEGYANLVQFTADSNNNNNNDANSMNFNKNSLNLNMSNGAMDMSVESAGATSLAYQAAMSSSGTSFASSSGYVGSLEMNIHPAFDNINTFSSENTSNLNECDVRYPMHSTKISTGESFESFEMTAHHKSFEMNVTNTSPNDDKENSGLCENSKVDMENHLSSYCYRDNSMFANVNNGDINRSFNGKELNTSRKRPFCAPKPDTPPSAPYWNNPIWGENSSPPMQLSLDLPSLTLENPVPQLSTPQVMSALAKKSRFTFENRENVE